ncbi:VCBS repeat-containing protein [Lewinella lacunae]|uniref:VCBS repeat-containing protein n=1 Tax=Neolewinella lacunae TaxID=1517758 RepID=A0A923T9H6_9BACT|nr:VCBS repeat-containing protein [Neolewinella lacunae]
MALVNCEPKNEAPASQPPFQLLRQAETGLDFRNTLTLSPEFNVFNYMYFYNGGGLAAGDFNQDGLIDLFFTSNMGENKMYLNEGQLKFRPVGAEAGLAGQSGWTTGASVVDINQDGLLDIYVSQVGNYLVLQGSNQLYVCQGIENGTPVFKDMAAEYGLDLVGFGTQATFFDYDLDGDLDLFQLNHSLHQNGTFGKRAGLKDAPHPLSGDRLLRNDGGRFTDITASAGIISSVVGYGLGVAAGDINGDGWPDLYIGNDFHENDYLYLNNQDGTFREVLTEQIQHTSRFSMGVDIADLNNDGNAEILSLDMLPEDPVILKSSLGEDGFDVFKFKLGFGYNPQFSRNTLQLNNGDGSFSEIGAFAGIHATDWSWAPLFFDMDHDGLKDLFVSNGIPRRMNDIDYINFKTNDDLKFKESFNDINKDDLSYVDKMPEVKIKNKFYRNQANLRFEDLSEVVRNGAVSYSSSAIVADLDNDGDLDVVTNNIDDEPFVYENLINGQPGRGHYLQLDLRGPTGNRNAIGASAIVYAAGSRKIYENYPVRGYQSSSAGPLHLGLGGVEDIDSILVVWPDRTYTRMPTVQYDTLLTVAWEAGLPAYDFSRRTVASPAELALEDITQETGIDFFHEENPFVDFTREPLIPHMVSTEGPALAVGDVNGDGLDDFFVGSSKRFHSALYLQRPDGSFQQSDARAIYQDSIFEDVDAAFFDLENDGDLDLVVAAGGNEYFANQEPRGQRVYVNNGQGEFTRQAVFPDLFMTASRVLPADVNGDGLTDLFFAGRVVPRFYGEIPASYLFINLGNGQFEDRTADWSPELPAAGMVKDGQWVDLDQDGDQDLLLAVDWEPILLFQNEGDRFVRRELTTVAGWWNTVEAADFDGDGDLDILAGNLGANNKFKPTPQTPLSLYLNDFDGDEKLDQVLTYYVKGVEIPFASHSELMKQFPSMKKRYLFAQDMAKSSMDEIFGKDKLTKAKKIQVTQLESAYLANDGNGNFSTELLPDPLQYSTLGAAARMPAMENGGSTWLVGGNFKGSNIEMGWYDASTVQALTVSPEGVLGTQRLGNLRIDGEVRAIRPITVGGRPAFLVARNNAALKLLRVPQ